LVAIPGAILGHKNKVVVYKGKTDLILTFVSMPIIALSLFDAHFDNAFSWTTKSLAVLFVIFSLAISTKANRSIAKAIVVLPTKYVLAGLMAFCALLAGQGLLEGLKAQRKKDYEEAAAKYMTAAIGAFGVYHLHKLISKFVRANPPPP